MLVLHHNTKSSQVVRKKQHQKKSNEQKRIVVRKLQVFVFGQTFVIHDLKFQNDLELDFLLINKKCKIMNVTETKKTKLFSTTS